MPDWTRRNVLVAGLAAAAAAACSTRPDVARLTYEATLFGLPLVMMESTRVAFKAQPWTFAHNRDLATPSLRTVVKPNVDTLYSTAWVDLARSPVRLTIPDTGKRYWLMQLLDGWTNVPAAPGSRTDGPGPHTYLLARAGDRVTPRAGEKVLRCPTDWAWLIGRFEVRSARELPEIHRIQDGCRLAALNPTAPPPRRPALLAATPEPAKWVRQLPAQKFLSLLGQLMASSPPTAADAPQLKRLRDIGIVPGQALTPGESAAVEAGYRRAYAELNDSVSRARLAQSRNGWTFTPGLGRYGTDYRKRAVASLLGLGANLNEDAIYLGCARDPQLRPLTGVRTYRLRFPAGQLPPVGAFWSVTVYAPDGNLVDNSIHRYALGSHDNLPANPDGSTDIVLANKAPADARSWLPTPAGPFQLTLRAYTPDRTILTGAWKPPAIQV